MLDENAAEQINNRHCCKSPLSSSGFSAATQSPSPSPSNHFGQMQMDGDLGFATSAVAQCDINGNCAKQTQGLESTCRQLRTENQRLQFHIRSLQRELMALKNAAAGGDFSARPEMQPGTLEALKLDRHRLHAEKLELLEQVRAAYRTMEEKERELRDFIRQHEARMRDTDKDVMQLIVEKESAERNRTQLESRLDEARNKINSLESDIARKDDANRRLQDQLAELQGRFKLLTGQSPSNNRNPDEDAAGSGQFRVSRSRQKMTIGTSLSSSSSSSSQLQDRFGALSAKRRDDSGHYDEHQEPQMLTAGEVGMIADLSKAELADWLARARSLPMSDWRQSHVLAMVELELGMLQYLPNFTENIKSGRVLMNLADNEFESVLRIQNPIHRKKLRLAIDDYLGRHSFPLNVREIRADFVAQTLLPSWGLGQFAENFRYNLVDGRLLDQASKKLLEKSLGMSRKAHQQALLKGVELLRLYGYDVKALHRKRLESEQRNLLYWTNAKFYQWLLHIDLQEYTDHIEHSGLHGAVCVLDAAFTADSLATLLQIPAHKSTIRKHLASEFSPLLFQARSLLAQEMPKVARKRAGGSLGRSFARSYSSNFEASAAEARKSLRASFGKVFGLGRGGGGGEIAPKNSCNSPQSAGHVSSNSTSTGSPSKQTPSPLNQDDSGLLQSSLSSNGTISSATSDLGSSIERSQHLQTIIGTPPQVLVQPPKSEFSAAIFDGSAGFLRKNPGRRQQAANKPQSMIELTHQQVTFMKYPTPVTTDYLAQILAPAPPPMSARLRPESMILTPPERRIGTIFEESEISPAPAPVLSAGGTPVKMRSKIRTSPRSRPQSLPVRPQPIEAMVARMNGVETDL